MTFSLTIWQRADDTALHSYINDKTGLEPQEARLRIYINGTPRKKVYFVAGKDGDLRWSSKTNDTPAKFRTGGHYGKIRKDADAAEEVAAAYGWTLGETPFAVALQVARDGIEVDR